ncbi:helix-turn-helix domain-containing protein [Lacihabitans soyangensis]|uniref:XRE family transcriptional regulator n=1 Tax=Lacihabitans soyangensis TaxID=869394 RepID=A0AAE3GY77_9BACT|nr:helix-turn-helix transcriptional regulator [Lacihabitans soyangensis]MCP9761372.1 XRE family transcriptional regulator [Lacihabitans soyangensis]
MSLELHLPIAIGKNLRNLRMNFGYSQQEISYMLDVTQTTYSKWESDLKTPTIKNIVKVSQFFKVPLEDIIYDTYLLKKADLKTSA